MYVTDMLVTLDKVTANNGKAQLVLSIDSNSIDELPRLVGMTGQLMGLRPPHVAGGASLRGRVARSP